MKKNIYIITGGTMVHVAPHFSLCAPAYGKVGDEMSEHFIGEILDKGLDDKYEVHVLPTKMAECIVSDYSCYKQFQSIYSQAGLNKLETNEDLSKLVDHLISLPDTRCIVMAAAVCDFEPSVIAEIIDSGIVDNPVFNFGKDQKRLSSRECYSLDLKPSEKILSKIRKARKDIFVVSFKTTSGVGYEETYRRGLESLKQNSSNLVFANDIKTHDNMIITPEEFPYVESTREEAIKTLAEMTISRLELTFNRTGLIEGEPADIQELADGGNIPENFVEVMKYLIANGAFKTFRGKTSGHFGCKVDGMPYERISSIRKVNHNNIFEDGVAKIYRKDGIITAEGGKPSVGEHTQQMIYDELGDEAHSIVHFHCPIRNIIYLPFNTREQKPFECGSNECGVNTATGMTSVGVKGVYAVHLENHGPNIAFHKDVDSSKIIEFIERYWDLSLKEGGIVEELDEFKVDSI
jgi:hypothetical protein